MSSQAKQSMAKDCRLQHVGQILIGLGMAPYPGNDHLLKCCGKFMSSLVGFITLGRSS